jgi:hypothetical protein
MDILEMDLDVDINGFAHTLPNGRFRQAIESSPPKKHNIVNNNITFVRIKITVIKLSGEGKYQASYGFIPSRQAMN